MNLDGANMNANMGKVAVLMGGRSAEREISLVSGRGCAGALREEGFDVVEIDPSASDLAAQQHQARSLHQLYRRCRQPHSTPADCHRHNTQAQAD